MATGYYLWIAAFYPDDPPQVTIGDLGNKPYLVAHSQYYILGRLFTIAFTILSIPVIYQLGRKAFGYREGIIGAGWWVLFPGLVYYAQVVRSDVAAAFFTALGLWLCLKVYEHPKFRYQILAGSSIGLAVATRYFMVALVPVLGLVDLLLLWKRQAFNIRHHTLLWDGMIAGAMSIPIAFALITPYFFLDYAGMVSNLTYEARGAHPGQDGLSFFGNLWWYLTTSIPNDISWSITIMSTIGIGFALYKRNIKQTMLLVYVAVFLTGIATSSLHWARWPIPIYPVLALFATGGLVKFSKLSIFPAIKLSQQQLLVLLIILFSLMPVYQLSQEILQLTNPGTRSRARAWILKNLPTEGAIAQESFTAPLANTPYSTTATFSLAQTKLTKEQATALGIKYLMVSSAVYNIFFDEPERYHKEVTFYKNLFDSGILVQEFNPTMLSGGPTIRIYELP